VLRINEAVQGGKSVAMEKELGNLKSLGFSRSQCRICNSKAADSMPLSCGHLAFCRDCINTLMYSKSSCPFCGLALAHPVRVFSS